MKTLLAAEKAGTLGDVKRRIDTLVEATDADAKNKLFATARCVIDEMPDEQVVQTPFQSAALPRRRRPWAEPAWPCVRTRAVARARIACRGAYAIAGCMAHASRPPVPFSEVTI